MLSVFSDEYYMKQAYQEAQQAFEADEIPIGAVVVCNNKVIARASQCFGRQIFGRMHALRHLGALPHVRRSPQPCPYRQGGLGRQ